MALNSFKCSHLMPLHFKGLSNTTVLTQHRFYLNILDIISFAEHDVVSKCPIDVQVNLTHVRWPPTRLGFHIL